MPRGKAQKSIELIAAMRAILQEIQPASVRAVCYQLFNRKLLTDMGKNETGKVSKQLTYAREEGIIPWEWVVDETRSLEGNPGWDDPEAFADVVQGAYHRNRWAEQAVVVQVWSEKGTVRGTLGPVLQKYGIQFQVMHGYGSATTVHDLAEFAQQVADDKEFVVLYVGDFDPSGLHMSEVDLPTRLHRYDGGNISLHRVALTANDVQRGDLADFPVEDKRRDPRYHWFTSRYDARCWELDAMSPVALRERVDTIIRNLITDRAAWERAELVQQVERSHLLDAMTRWTTILQQGAS